jgi:3-deoxy-D-manno-octulosonic-acid transferase
MNSLTLLLYNLFIRIYGFAVKLAALRNRKAGDWVKGRKHLFEELKSKIHAGDAVIWVHCASAGEFEQGKPLIEELKKQFPAYKVLVSFFSPSGYAAGKKYELADIVTYLPLDTSKNAKNFVQLVQPKLAVFVKYEYWYHHLSTVAFHHIPLLLVSAIFRKEQVFFKWYGKFFRQMLFLFRQIFVQDEASAQLLKQKGIDHCSVAGDTRFDRVTKIVGNFSDVELIKEFIGERKTIVAGSTWPEDEQLLASTIKNSEVKLIVAPHEINPSHIALLRKTYPHSLLYSEVKHLYVQSSKQTTTVWDKVNEEQKDELQKKLVAGKVLIIDTMGMLSRLYHYATITYIGGGFNKSGIHNTLEAAVWGKPVVFGPNYGKFKEARELINAKAAMSISNAEELKQAAEGLLWKEDELMTAGRAAGDYVAQHTGATQKIVLYIYEKRLLTRS